MPPLFHFAFLFSCAALLPPDRLILAFSLNILDEMTPIPTTTSSRVPSLDAVRHYLYYTEAVCSDDLAQWDCPLCHSTGPGVVLVDAFEKKEFSTKAIVNRDDVRKEVVVTWRGSVNVQNLLQDFHATKTITYNGIGVHTGDWGDMNTLYDEVSNSATQQLVTHSDYALTVVGHSLGAAEAALFLYKLTQEGKMSKIPPVGAAGVSRQVSLFVYGMPRCGDRTFAQWYNGQNFTVGRVVNHKDLIPHVIPSALGFTHINTELWINGGDDASRTKVCRRDLFEDPECSNSKGPFYSISDHLHYYDVTFKTCKFSLF